MTPQVTDRNLLFGVLALQSDLIDIAQFADACTAWASRKESSLADLLIERGWLTPVDKSDIERLVDRKLKKHGSNAIASVAATPAEARAVLAGIDDDGVQDTVSRLPQSVGQPTPSTIAYQPQGRDRYLLTRLHARGGIGQVWFAHDSDLGRDIALKELRGDLAAQSDTRARFVEEAKITGQLEHPGIVPVYELVCRKENEPPFYTMRFIRGRTLHEAAKAFQKKRLAGAAPSLELRELVTAFVGVCNAVAYTHSRGVIHRDLKGHNVVLGDFGEVMVIDWGLAKVLKSGDGSTPAVILHGPGTHGETLQGQVLGTPSYMAPEQAEGHLHLVNERSDVYSLGAILYEILTGQPPFTGAETQAVIYQVIHETPAAPRTLNLQVAPALEAVCLKALARRPQARYESASALADDVRCWLADEPVTARPEPLAARLTRWGRRHKPLVASATALLLVIAAALGIGNVLLGRANARIENERQQTQDQRDRANANFDKARQAVDEYFTQVSENKLLKSPLPGMQPLRKDLLEAALRYYRAFAEERRDDPALQVELARAQYRVGRLIEDLGTKRDALQAYEEASVSWERVVHDHPDERSYERELARCYVSIGRVKGQYLAQPEDARNWLDKAQTIDERVVREKPDNLEFQSDLANTYEAVSAWHAAQGRPANEEEPYSEKALAIWERIAQIDRRYESDLAGGLLNLGYCYTRTGSTVKALQTLDRARALLDRLAKENPADLSFRQELSRAYINLGYVHHVQTLQYDKAYEYYLENLKIVSQLARENPSVNRYQLSLASTQMQTADLLQQDGRADQGVPLAKSAAEILEKLRVTGRENHSISPLLIRSYHLLGTAALAAHQDEDAGRYFQKARAVAQEDAAAQPDNTDSQRYLARSYLRIAELENSVGKPENARKSVGEAIAVLQKHGKGRANTSIFFQNDLADYYLFLGKLEARADHRAQAVEAFERSLPIQEKVAQQNPSNFDFQIRIVATLLELGQVQRANRNLAAAFESFNKARTKAESIVAPTGRDTILRRQLGLIDLRIAGVERDAGHFEHALRAVRQALVVLEVMPPPMGFYDLACAHALCAAVMGQSKSALTDAEKGQQKEEADQAVTAFARAVKAGFRDFERAKQDHDLDALRGRDDFKKLMAEVEDKK